MDENRMRVVIIFKYNQLIFTYLIHKIINIS